MLKQEIVVLVLVLAFGLVGTSSWIYNAVKLSYCDFKPDYKCEIVHSAGLVLPPLSMVTVWYGDDRVIRWRDDN